jgi:hypothetical protein
MEFIKENWESRLQMNWQEKQTVFDRVRKENETQNA